MKHQAKFPTKDRSGETTAKGDLQMFALAGVAEDGSPILLGPDPASVLALEPAPERTEGLVAICKTYGPGGKKLAVLGYVGRDALTRVAATHSSNGDVVLGTGKAKLRLCADGRVRLEGEDVKLQSHGRMALRGAYINLN